MDRIMDEVAWKTQLYNRYIQLLPKNKDLRIYKEERNQEFSNTAIKKKELSNTAARWKRKVFIVHK